jgi:hypothetical protein
VFTVAKLCGIAIVVGGGAVRLFQGHTESFQTGDWGWEEGVVLYIPSI